jgi:hypothetical protein
VAESNNTPLVLAGLGLIGFGLFQLAKQKGVAAAAPIPIGTFPPLIPSPMQPPPTYVNPAQGGPPPGAYASSTQPGGPGSPSASLPTALASTGQAAGLGPLPGYPGLQLFSQPRQLIAGVGQQGPGAGVVVRGYPPPPPRQIVVAGPTAGRAGTTAVIVKLPLAASVAGTPGTYQAGIRRQGQPY